MGVTYKDFNSDKNIDLDEWKKTEIPMRFSYPFDPDYELETSLKRVDLDKRRVNHILTDNGFVVTTTKGSLKNNMKNPNGIHSTRFGQTLGDLNPHMNRYRCKCGRLRSRINHDKICEVCKEKVKYVDDNFEYFGWLTLIDEYPIIHPNIYREIDFLFGKGYQKKSILENIITVKDDKDMNGFSIENQNKPKNEPWFGLGMIGFVKNFDEIMDYYVKKKPQKREVYDHIMEDRKKVFTNSIPVFTTLLRPMDIREGTMSFESTNGLYTIMNTLVFRINKVKTRADREEKPKNEKLCKLQMKFNELYTELEQILSGKKGQLRNLIGGRCTFTSREVIGPDPSLRVDQIKMSYYALVVLLEPRINNILCKTYNIYPAQANKIIEKAKMKRDENIVKIIEAIINSYKDDGMCGMPCLINRNPTIGYGSILQVYCIGINDNYSMSVPLQSLVLYGGDFDGDVLNILLIINKAFAKRAEEVFNPRNAMFVSSDDGKMNPAIMHQRDTMINANVLMHMGRDKYSKEQLNKIYAIKERNNRKFHLR